MRIISGKYKGKALHPPAGLRARPTTDFAKEGLFNILGNHFSFGDIEVADLFSGTGSIGYEFASRGAKKVLMVENREVHTRFIRKTILQLGLDACRVYPGNVFVYLKKPGGPFDIVFADPPYDMDNLDDLPALVLDGGFLKSGGWFVLEHGKKHRFESHPRFQECRKYGSVHFSIFI